jgi:hypothetical protein
MAKTPKLSLLQRPRRLRRQPSRRALVAETVLRVEDLIAPLFVVEGKARPDPIASMPGVFRLGIDDLVKECRELHQLGVPAVALFPKLSPKLKNEEGTEALNPETLVLRAVRAVRKAVPELTIITDVALDPYTTHGHDGVLNESGDDVDNDRTVAILSRMAVLQAEAGVDFVAPSDMMDGRVGAIRLALEAAGFSDTGILLRTVPRRGGQRPGRRHAPAEQGDVPDESRQPPRGPARSRTRCGRRRRHRDGQAGGRLPRYHPRGAQRRRHARGGLPGVGRVCPDPRRGAAGLARSRPLSR